MAVKPYVVSNLIGEGILEITFFHPSHNALPGNLLAALSHQIDEAGVNPEVKVVILKSGGDRTFCAGASFNELVAIENEAQGLQFFMGFANVINAIRKCPKLVIGRVQGKAVGGGVGLAAAVDYCLATKFAAIKLSELAIGIGPFVIGPAVERKIGQSAFGQMAIDAANFQSAEWARSKGLYAEIFETQEELDQSVNELAATLSNYNPESQQQLKNILWEGTSHWSELLAERAAISGRLVLSEFTKEVLNKYKQI